MSNKICRTKYFNYGSYLNSRGYDQEICNLITSIKNGEIALGSVVPSGICGVTLKGAVTIAQCDSGAAPYLYVTDISSVYINSTVVDSLTMDLIGNIDTTGSTAPNAQNIIDGYTYIGVGGVTITLPTGVQLSDGLNAYTSVPVDAGTRLHNPISICSTDAAAITLTAGASGCTIIGTVGITTRALVDIVFTSTTAYSAIIYNSA